MVTHEWIRYGGIEIRDAAMSVHAMLSRLLSSASILHTHVSVRACALGWLDKKIFQFGIFQTDLRPQRRLKDGVHRNSGRKHTHAGPCMHAMSTRLANLHGADAYLLPPIASIDRCRQQLTSTSNSNYYDFINYPCTSFGVTQQCAARTSRQLPVR